MDTTPTPNPNLATPVAQPALPILGIGNDGTVLLEAPYKAWLDWLRETVYNNEHDLMMDAPTPEQLGYDSYDSFRAGFELGWKRGRASEQSLG